MTKSERGGVWALLSLFSLACALAAPNSASAQAKAATSADGLPTWVKGVGAKRAPKSRRLFWANSFGAIGDGVKNSTKAIQQAIDACTKAGGGIVTFQPGHYVT